MHTLMKTKDDGWIVGLWQRAPGPDRGDTFIRLFKVKTQLKALQLVNWLNGGNNPIFKAKEFEDGTIKYLDDE